MAKNELTIRIVVEGSKKAQKDLKKVKKDVEEVAKQTKKSSEEMRESFDKVKQGIKRMAAGFDQLTGGVISRFVYAIKQVGDSIKNVLMRIKDFISNGIQRLRNGFSNVGNAAKGFLVKLKDLAVSGLQFVGEKLGYVWRSVKLASSVFFGFASGPLNFVKNVLVNVGQSLINIGVNVAGRVKAGLLNMWDGFKNLAGGVGDVAKGIGGLIKGGLSKLGDMFKPVTNAAKNFVGSIGGMIGNLGNLVPVVGGVIGGFLKLGGAIGAAVTAATAVPVALGIKTAMQMETLEIAFTTLGGSADEAGRILDRIKEEAKATPFEMTGLAEITQLLMGSGLEADRAIDSILMMGDALAAVGKGDFELKRLGNTLSQVFGKGKADAVDFKEIVNAGWVSVRQDVAATLGISIDGLEKLIEEGKIGFEEIEATMQRVTSEGEKFGGAMVRQSESLQGIFDNLKDTINLSLGEFAKESGIFDTFKGIMLTIKDAADAFFQGLLNNAPLINTAIENLKLTFGSLLETLGFTNEEGNNMATTFGETISWAISKVIEFINGLIEGFMPWIEPMKEAFGGLGESFMSIGGAVNETGLGIQQATIDMGLMDGQTTTSSAMLRGLGGSAAIATEKLDLQKDSIEENTSKAENLGGKVGSLSGESLTNLINTVKDVIDWVDDNKETMLEYMGAIAQAALAVAALISMLMDLGEQLQILSGRQWAIDIVQKVTGGGGASQSSVNAITQGAGGGGGSYAPTSVRNNTSNVNVNGDMVFNTGGEQRDMNQTGLVLTNMLMNMAR